MSTYQLQMKGGGGHLYECLLHTHNHLYSYVIVRELVSPVAVIAFSVDMALSFRHPVLTGSCMPPHCGVNHIAACRSPIKATINAEVISFCGSVWPGGYEHNHGYRCPKSHYSFLYNVYLTMLSFFFV